MVNNLNCLKEVRRLPEISCIKSANKDIKADLKVEFAGTILTKSENERVVKLKDVLYSKSVSKNLFSIRKLINRCTYERLDNRGTTLLSEETKRF